MSESERRARPGEGLPHEAADIPDAETIGGRTSSSRAARQVLDAVEEREPDRGSSITRYRRATRHRRAGGPISAA